jgi:hypothetical protein
LKFCNFQFLQIMLWLGINTKYKKHDQQGCLQSPHNPATQDNRQGAQQDPNEQGTRQSKKGRLL